MKYKYNNEWKDLNVKVSDTYPIGAITPYGGDTAPTNWLICDGTAVSRITYADLFSVIGTSFGSGDGSTTFNLPDLRSRVPLGKDSRDEDFDTIGNTYGEKEHTLTVNEMPSHTHNLDDAIYGNNVNKLGIRQDGGGGSHSVPSYASTNSNSAYVPTNTGGSQSHNIVQPSTVTNYIIKAFQSVGIVGNVAREYTESDEDTYNCNFINKIIDAEAYSTDEIKTNKVWIDGKPVYRKVVEIESLPNNTTISYDTDISNGVLCRFEIFGKLAGTETDIKQFPYISPYSSTGNIYAKVEQDASKVTIQTSTDRSSGFAWAIIEYTKTTD